MSAEVAEAIRQTRRTLAEKTWVPHDPWENAGEVCIVSAAPEDLSFKVWKAMEATLELKGLAQWNDRQTDVGAVLGMTLQALIAELCKPTLAQPATEA